MHMGNWCSLHSFASTKFLVTQLSRYLYVVLEDRVTCAQKHMLSVHSCVTCSSTWRGNLIVFDDKKYQLCLVIR